MTLGPGAKMIATDASTNAASLWPSTTPKTYRQVDESCVTSRQGAAHAALGTTYTFNMASSNSVRPTALTWILVAVGVLMLIAAVVYFTQPADALPSFFPGADATDPDKHIKHGIAAAGLGAVLFVGAWMTTGSKNTN